jgi:hypothetical protein
LAAAAAGCWLQGPLLALLLLLCLQADLLAAQMAWRPANSKAAAAKKASSGAFMVMQNALPLSSETTPLTHGLWQAQLVLLNSNLASSSDASAVATGTPLKRGCCACC